MNGACSLAEVCEGHRVHCTCRSLHCNAKVWVILFLIYRHTDFLIVPLLNTHNMYVPLLQKPLKNTLQNLPVLLYQQLHFAQLWFVKFAHTDFQDEKQDNGLSPHMQLVLGVMM